jgi:hypothetical protein
MEGREEVVERVEGVPRLEEVVRGKEGLLSCGMASVGQQEVEVGLELGLRMALAAVEEGEEAVEAVLPVQRLEVC